jgi:Anti-sigma factor NepR
MEAWSWHDKDDKEEWGMQTGGNNDQAEPTMKMDSSEAISGGTESLPANVQDVIGRRLKTIYQDIVQQPVPDNILQLLAELEARERGQ